MIRYYVLFLYGFANFQFQVKLEPQSEDVRVCNMLNERIPHCVPVNGASMCVGCVWGVGEGCGRELRWPYCDFM